MRNPDEVLRNPLNVAQVFDGRFEERLAHMPPLICCRKYLSYNIRDLLISFYEKSIVHAMSSNPNTQ